MAGINSKSIYLVHIAVFAVSDKKGCKSSLAFPMKWQGTGTKMLFKSLYILVSIYIPSDLPKLTIENRLSH